MPYLYLKIHFLFDMKNNSQESSYAAIENLVFGLFNDFRKGVFLQYLFTLLRVGPLDSYEVDPFEKLFRRIIKKDKKLNLDNEEVFWSFLLNMIFVSRQGNYNPHIFLYGSENFRKETINTLKNIPGKYDNIVDLYFPKEWERLSEEEKDYAFNFVKGIYIQYRKALRQLTTYPKYIKLSSNFDIVELIIDYRRKSVNGFKIHFSNGTHASFKRSTRGVDCINLDLSDDIVGVMVGPIDELKDEWIVGDKPLYEIGLPFRYNKLGEWKPLIFPGKSDALQERAHKLANGDDRIVGVLFYIFCTGHRVIEFAARSRLKLPEEITSFKTGLHLYQVPAGDKADEVIIDGWIELNSIEAENIIIALDIIEKTFSFLSFTYDAEIEWTLKYNLVNQIAGIVMPTKDDMRYLNKVLRGLRNDPDNFIISSVDWFERGVSSRNPFNEYICYYLSIETLALKLAAGKTEKSRIFNISNVSKNNDEIKGCLKNLEKLYFEENPKKYIDKAYNDCLKTLNQRLKASIVAVFGDESIEYKELFVNKPSIQDIRHRLVHEPYSNWSPDEQVALNLKLAQVRTIAKDFILRVCFEIKQGENLDKREHIPKLSLPMDNPNSVFVASHLKIFPTSDWKIKAAWINSRR